jgi:uncharacterized tellurite resistance protein B-like protein
MCPYLKDSGGRMLDAIKSFFDSSMSAEQVAEDEQVPDIRLAACALLLELAYADDEFTDDEAAHLKAAVRRQYGVDSSEADELIRLADEQRKDAVDLFQFTSLIRDNYSLGQKMVLAEIMWGVVYADGEISADEEYLMRKVCNLLKLEPGYLADLRKRVEGS